MSRWFALVLIACSPPAKPPPSNASQATAKPPAIAVQLAYRGTFAIGPPFSQVPPFTLLDDGTVIVAGEDQQLSTAKLSRDETDRIVRRVRELGFERLESHRGSCKHNPDGTGLCVSDAAYTILRATLPSGKLHEVTTYADFSNEPEIHQKIIDYLSAYRPARTTPYRPTSGVLHVRVEHGPITPPCPEIDPAILHVEKDQTMWALQIEGPALAPVLAIAGARRRFTACAGAVQFQLVFLPAVPGSDLSGELEPYHPKP